MSERNGKMMPLDSALELVLEGVADRIVAALSGARAEDGPSRRARRDLLANPPALLTVPEALRILRMRDSDGRRFLHDTGLIGLYGGRELVSFRRLEAVGYREEPTPPANDDDERPDGVTFATDL